MDLLAHSLVRTARKLLRPRKAIAFTWIPMWAFIVTSAKYVRRATRQHQI